MKFVLDLKIACTSLVKFVSSPAKHTQAADSTPTSPLNLAALQLASPSGNFPQSADPTGTSLVKIQHELVKSGFDLQVACVLQETTRRREALC